MEIDVSSYHAEYEMGKNAFPLPVLARNLAIQRPSLFSLFFFTFPSFLITKKMEMEMDVILRQFIIFPFPLPVLVQILPIQTSSLSFFFFFELTSVFYKERILLSFNFTRTFCTSN